MKRKPLCTSFIIAAIREVRPKTHGLRPGTASGVSLKKIFIIATTVYSTEQFIKALGKLLQKGTVILSAETHLWSERADGSNTSYTGREIVRLAKAPTKERCSEENWWDGDDGKSLKPPITDKSGRGYSDIRLHVRADGLPNRIAKLVTNLPLIRNHTATEMVAERILTKLRKK